MRPAPERRRGEAQRAADVHGVAEDIERETLDTCGHEDAEVVAEERPRHAECPRRTQHERLPRGEERSGDKRCERRGEERLARLVLKCALVPAETMSDGGMGEQGRKTHRWSRKSPQEKMQNARK
jgi:hypothetical protein